MKLPKASKILRGEEPSSDEIEAIRAPAGEPDSRCERFSRRPSGSPGARQTIQTLSLSSVRDACLYVGFCYRLRVVVKRLLNLLVIFDLYKEGFAIRHKFLFQVSLSNYTRDS